MFLHLTKAFRLRWTITDTEFIGCMKKQKNVGIHKNNASHGLIRTQELAALDIFLPQLPILRQKIESEI